MSRVLFVDPVCPQPYTVDTLNSGVLGGTEATVVRVARELSKRHEVRLQQRGRSEETKDALGITYAPQGSFGDFDPNVVITLRDGRVYRETKDALPDARHYLWLHDVVAGEYKAHLETTLQGTPVHVLTVSNWHKGQVTKALALVVSQGLLKMSVMYPTVESYCEPTQAPVDPKKLIFLSSPHKGLQQVLDLFELVRATDPNFTLYVTNPGYYKDHDKFPEGVVNLGPTTHSENIAHLRTSLCLFYPQTQFAETFGIVYAEANAVGTPVIAHDIGAAREVLDHPKQILPPDDPQGIVDTIVSWAKGARLTVRGNKLFSLAETMKEWHKLIQFDKEKTK